MKSPPRIVAWLLLAFCVTACQKPGTAGTRYRITDEPITLEYWVPLWYYETGLESAAELPLYAELERITGITIQFRHPSPNYDIAKDFAAMVASDDLPDIIESDWRWEPIRTPDVAIDEGIILPIDRELQTLAPNFMKYVLEDNSIARYITDASGRIYGFPGIEPGLKGNVDVGPMLRADWLEELGVSAPVTIGEWESVLSRLKKKTDTIFLSSPFLLTVTSPRLSDDISLESLERSNFLAGAYGTSYGFISDGGRLLYGPATPEYRDMLITLNRWFTEGLIHSYIADSIVPVFPYEQLIASGGMVGPASWLWQLRPIRYVAAPLPRLERDPDVRIGPYSTPPVDIERVAAITTSNNNVVESVRWLDYGYSDDGQILMNFGISGESYKRQRGVPELTEEVLTNLDAKVHSGRIWEATIGRYSRFVWGGPFPYSEKMADTITESVIPGSSEILDGWANVAIEDPTGILALYREARDRFEKRYTPIRRYRNDMFLSFVTGEISMDYFDAYVTELNRRGLREAIAILQETWQAHLSKPLPTG